jgi:hypothetical protein
MTSTVLGFWRGTLLRDCPQRKRDRKRVYHVQEATAINDVSRSVTKLYVTIKNRQVEHQASVVKLEGIISKQPYFYFD